MLRRRLVDVKEGSVRGVEGKGIEGVLVGIENGADVEFVSGSECVDDVGFVGQVVEAPLEDRAAEDSVGVEQVCAWCGVEGGGGVGSSEGVGVDCECGVGGKFDGLAVKGDGGGCAVGGGECLS